MCSICPSVGICVNIIWLLSDSMSDVLIERPPVTQIIQHSHAPGMVPSVKLGSHSSDCSLVSCQDVGAKWTRKEVDLRFIAESSNYTVIIISPFY